MTYSADNALQIAMQLERLGKTIYDSLAKRSTNRQIADLAAVLASQEKKHLWIFQKMYHSLPINHCGPAISEQQLIEIAGKFYKLILPTFTEIRKIAISQDTSKLIALAMQMESDSIAFYLTMTADPGEAAIIREIVEEEKKHLASLRKAL